MSAGRLVRVTCPLFRMFDSNIESGRWTFCPGCSGMIAASRGCEQWACVGRGAFSAKVPGFALGLCCSP